MHFDFDAYEKVFSDEVKPVQVESVVETFKPTEEMAKDNKPGEVAEKAVEIPAEAPAPKVETAGEPLPESEELNGKCNTDLSAG